jgi:hypothetical protein
MFYLLWNQNRTQINVFEKKKQLELGLNERLTNNYASIRVQISKESNQNQI